MILPESWLKCFDARVLAHHKLYNHPDVRITGETFEFIVWATHWCDYRGRSVDAASRYWRPRSKRPGYDVELDLPGCRYPSLKSGQVDNYGGLEISSHRLQRVLKKGGLEAAVEYIRDPKKQDRFLVLGHNWTRFRGYWLFEFPAVEILGCVPDASEWKRTTGGWKAEGTDGVTLTITTKTSSELWIRISDVMSRTWHPHRVSVLDTIFNGL